MFYNRTRIHPYAIVRCIILCINRLLHSLNWHPFKVELLSRGGKNLYCNHPDKTSSFRGWWSRLTPDASSIPKSSPRKIDDFHLLPHELGIVIRYFGSKDFLKIVLDHIRQSGSGIHIKNSLCKESNFVRQFYFMGT